MAKTTPGSVAAMLRAEIDRSGISVYEVAQRADLTRSTVHRFYHGGDIRTETAERLAAALGCTLTLQRMRRRGPSSK